MATDLLEVTRRLTERGQRCAVVTVIWRRGPSSGKTGYRMVVTDTGEVHGWVGGSCAEPALVREARRAIDDETPRLVLLGTSDDLASRGREGMVEVPITCQSEGALEVFIEPKLPAPHLVVVGRSPMVHTLAGLSLALGWRTTVVDDGGSEEGYPGVDEVITTLDLKAAGVGPKSAVVVATQGHYDEEALERALRTPAGWVGVVASHRRAESLLAYVRQQGFSDENLARVHAPAGLDLGPVVHEEIAVAVLAELVQFKASGGLKGEGGDVAAPVARQEAIDPVCGMTVEVATARHQAEHGGETYYFCCAGCQKSFEANPEEYLRAEDRSLEPGGTR